MHLCAVSYTRTLCRGDFIVKIHAVMKSYLVVLWLYIITVCRLSRN